MKTILPIFCALFLSTTIFAQIFTDNFDSYTAGTDLVVQNPTDWDTWSGGAGTTEDVAVSNANSSSASNSLYFSSTASGGGPEDIILRFAQVYNSGNFSLEANFYVESGKGGYFNMQETFVVAGVWAIDCYMLNTGTLKFSNSGTTYLTSTYPTGQWFNMRIEIDLTANNWEVFINNVSAGSFANPTGSIGILDFYPVNPASQGGNNLSGFYVDDVSYDHVPASLPPVNAGITFVSQVNGVVGSTPNIECRVRNLGTDTITSFDIEYIYNNLSVQESVGPVSMSSLENYQHTFATPVNLIAGSNPLTVVVTNVNGAGADANVLDDSSTITINPPVTATGKVVFGEEATGTWCQWCPRGAVYMDYMEETYGNAWAGVAVHNGDPMAETVYDPGLGTLISGYPSSLVDRGSDADPSAMETEFLQRVQIAPTSFITNGATWNQTTRQLEVSVSTNWQSAASGDWKLGLVLTEDSLSGTTSGWAQSNAYAGGGSGVMGGFELLPNPVPASQMNYNHVARVIVPSFEGGSVFPATIASGQMITECFSFSLPSGWDENKIHIISFLKDPSGRIDNAGKETIASAVANGYVNCVTEVTKVALSEDKFKLFPNPSNGVAFIDIINNDNKAVNVTILDLSGKIISQRDYNITGTVQLPIVTNKLAKGMYIVKLTIGDTIQQQKLIVK
ncbi:T9SS type A sorting domain-containing protein [Aureispira]|nr:T9SS type A sorting domain-containing protein [Aureispira sp.]